ncbi:succinate--CoA ligase subunit beta [Methanospirillum stamsii]|uniref:Succinyl-CoA synthetase subunit beta n=1 Tax=Methanospirillum stamsii TaxID=1277351 RepID=A0A2V2NHA6_9EURY|nr:succinate-CoA ligase subunit beta [Methanospirillum stamsii]PWR75787.1 succinyl-CoA synthetase subunit beta [Methanospirillum stamsii]
MKMKEYEAKEILSKAGIRIPRGLHIKKGVEFMVTPAIREAVVKAQVEVAGRGKAGGILMAEYDQIPKTVEQLFNAEIKGVPVEEILIEEKLNIQHEYYLSITIDRSKKAPVILFTTEGGVDIEEVAQKNPDAIRKAMVHPLLSTIPGYTLRYLLNGAPKEIGQVIQKLYTVFMTQDAILAEINPLVMTPDGLYAADGKIILDDNALARHGITENRDLSERERQADAYGFSFVELSGNIGVIGNGAGLTMATVDLINNLGGKPANFLDVGGGADRVRVAHAVRLLGKMPDVKVIIVNLLGGITRCDEVAAGIIEAGVGQKIIVRLAGTNETEGKALLSSKGYLMLDTMEEAVKAAVEAAS